MRVWNAPYRPRDGASYLDYDSDTGPDQPDRDRDVLSIRSDIRSFGYHDRRDLHASRDRRDVHTRVDMTRRGVDLSDQYKICRTFE